jgi:hypothetical protein
MVSTCPRPDAIARQWLEKDAGLQAVVTGRQVFSMLRTLQEVFHVMPLLNDAANQPSLSDLFTSYP